MAPMGAVVRASGPCIGHKTVDPAVVAVDVGGRWAVSLFSGHKGGANDLALAVANMLGAEPVISTATEAAKDLIVGVGCRRGAAAGTIVAAIRGPFAAGCDLARVRQFASAEMKADEAGLNEAAQRTRAALAAGSRGRNPLSVRAFARSDFVQKMVDLPAVAEPAAILAGRRTQLVLPKQILQGVTVAIARESCMSLE